MIKPKKTLGQNFLQDKNIANKIVDAIEHKEGDIIIEIGPGLGALTELMLDRGYEVIAVDVDQRAIEELENKFSDYSNLRLIHSDIRDIKLQDLIVEGKDLKVIGNLPYNISSDIFFFLFEQSQLIKRSVIMIQKEVAQRLVAVPKTKAYGILSVARELVSEAKLEFDVSPNCFYPKPKVTSSVVSLDFTKDYSIDEFFNVMKVCKAAFNQRRKVLRNPLKSIIEQKGQKTAEFDTFLKEAECKNYLTMRAEELSTDDFKILEKEIQRFHKA